MPHVHRLGAVTLRRARSDRGFTLVETMLAVAVFLVGFVSVARMQLLSSQQLAAAGHKERATQLLASLIDVARVLPEAQLKSWNTPKVLYYGADNELLAAADAQKAFYTLRASTTTQTNYAVQTYSLTVDVRWTEPYSASVQGISVVTWVPGT